MLLIRLLRLVHAARYSAYEADYNINVNKSATDVADYYAEWTDHAYTPSPTSWTIPFYSLFLDRFADGDPTNNEANGTVWEFDFYETQFRAGGDVKGLIQRLDYIQSMGMEAIHIIGTPYLNLPWTADQYSVRDLTILDRHLGTLVEWRELVDAIHSRQMYLMLDITVGTMSNYLGFASRYNDTNYANSSTPLDSGGYNLLYRDSLYAEQHYLDLVVSNETTTCQQPVFYNTSAQVDITVPKLTCFDDDFVHYGDSDAFSAIPSWERQITRFASIQDRLAIWRPSVLQKSIKFACLLIDALDVDAFRIDKATQMPPDSLASWSEAVRHCAAIKTKKNFFIAGEITEGNHFASIYVGRGRTLEQFPVDLKHLVEPDVGGYLRSSRKSALDASAFHYSIYRVIQSILNIPGQAYGNNEVPSTNLVVAYKELLRTNDLKNVNTGKIDPRHMMGMLNHDVFRWPAVEDGLRKYYLGMILLYLMLPGAPLAYYGEEQNFQILDNPASNFLYGRQPMFSNQAWQTHGCYTLGSVQYSSLLNFTRAEQACLDEGVSLDHFDSSTISHNVLKQVMHLRKTIGTLKDGWSLEHLGSYDLVDMIVRDNHTQPVGLWSVSRKPAPQQNLGSNTTVWFLYSNSPTKKTYSLWDCSRPVEGAVPYSALISPFLGPVKMLRNLLYPYELYNLTRTDRTAVLDPTAAHSCLPSITLNPYSVKVLTDVEDWVHPIPSVVAVEPKHDERILATNESQTVPFKMLFSAQIPCDVLAKQLAIKSYTFKSVQIRLTDLTCANITRITHEDPEWAPSAVWQITGKLEDVQDGIHKIILQGNYSANAITSFPGREEYLFRKGRSDNPMVFNATWSGTLIEEVTESHIMLNHGAAGAQNFRYSTNWQSSWSDWITLDSPQTNVPKLPWNGTHAQAWQGDHIVVQYWSEAVQSAHHVQQADTVRKRYFPHLFIDGDFNRHGYDASISSHFRAHDQGNYTWHYPIMTEWPTNVTLNLWGINPDGRPDIGYIYGDIDRDYVLDRVPPGLTLQDNVIRLTSVPPSPFLSYDIQVNDETRRYWIQPVGRRWVQILIYLWSLIIPITLGCLAMSVYAGAFNTVHRNRFGVKQPFYRSWMRLANHSHDNFATIGTTEDVEHHRKVLIATLEYDIPPLKIKIKIGGLGVMSQLMGAHLQHCELIWVVPMVGDVEYPTDIFDVEQPFEVEVHGMQYGINCYRYVSENVTYLLLASPVFSKQTKSDPYPPRMDDLESAVFYSAWNQCIAQSCMRHGVDIYHINDYHGALAPLYLLPQVVPCALSLHNAEFQGLWPLRTEQEKVEVCSIFNIDRDLCTKYVQFGNTFNLLHTAVSYLRIHQSGFGAVGVSDKYGARSLARYPIFWALKSIGKLPNPDPSDLDSADDNLAKKIEIDWEAEKRRKEHKRETQEWANLKIDPNAQLLVFVGRWSVQKGIDLIADLAPTLLDDYNVQLVTVGPVVDLYGKFAAEKLSLLMQKYPGRLMSKPVFTACPPALFMGADFALIPSRDEPFGLVAVEFGRKGALGIGCKVGGLGTMPGWWYTMNSASASHLSSQFEAACRAAITSTEKVRAQLRACAAKQRFPVAVWKNQVDVLHARCIQTSKDHNDGHILPREVPIIGPQHIQLAQLTEDTVARMDSVIRRPMEPELVPRMPPIPGRVSALHVMSLGSHRGPSGQYQADDESIESDHEIEVAGVPSVEQQLTDFDQYLESFGIVPQPEFPTRLSDSDDSDDVSESLRSSAEMSVFSYQAYREQILLSDMSEPRSLPPIPMNQRQALDEYSRLSKNHNDDLPIASGRVSALSLNDLELDARAQSSNIKKGEIMFDDADGSALRDYIDELEKGFSASESKRKLCIENFINTAEKKFFDDLKRSQVKRRSKHRQSVGTELDIDQLRGMKRLMARRGLGWPIYTILLALGQVLAANTYQLTLLSGVSNTSKQIYILNSVFMVMSCVWYYMYRRLQAIYVVACPFLCYGFAFILIGLPHISSIANLDSGSAVTTIAAILYATGSASGSLFFALNFGSEGGIETKRMVMRACIMQGLQQIWTAVLWYWGHNLDSGSAAVNKLYQIQVPPVLAILCWIFGTFLLIIAVCLYLGLPKYYRQVPSSIPAFYRSLYRRKIIVWFLISQVLSNFWLALPYGASWNYLYSSRYLRSIDIALMVIFFLVVIWIVLMIGIRRLTTTHTWVPVIFAIGTIAPRYFAEFWAVSTIGAYIPWASPVGSAFLGRGLWLWLTVLDGCQGIGFGIMLLQTLIRDHVAFTLVCAQVIGAFTTIIAKACNIPFDKYLVNLSAWSPDQGAGPWTSPGLWICLTCQLLIPLGYLFLYRKSQLAF